MKADMVLDALMDLQATVKRLHDPDIITAEVGEYRPPRVHLQITGDPTDIIRDIGTGLIDVDDDWDPAWIYKSMTDITGVEVYWLEMKKAPDAATSGAPEDKMETTATGIISQGNEEVKEAHHEINH